MLVDGATIFCPPNGAYETRALANSLLTLANSLLNKEQEVYNSAIC